MEELEEGCNPGKCGKRWKRARAGNDPCGSYYGKEAKDFKVVGTATISV